MEAICLNLNYWRRICLRKQKRKNNCDRNDKKLLGQVLEIYDQKYVAELLRKVGKNEWSRETLNRWINGKCSPKTLTLAEEELHEKCFRKRLHITLTMPSGLLTCLLGLEVYGRASKPSVASAFLPVNGIKRLCAHIKLTGLTMLRNTFNLDIREVTLSDKPEVPENDAYAYINEHVPDHDVLLAGFPVNRSALRA
jgi:DNA (cytosine-5)-methyltransferase 1